MRIIQLFSILFVILIFGCQNEIESNQKLKENIDSLQINRIIYEIEMDTLYRIMDTLSIEKNKIVDDIMVFQEKTTFTKKGNLISTKYYKSNENLFYNEYKSSVLGIVSISEFYEKDDEIIRGVYTSYKDNAIERVYDMDYTHNYSDDGVKLKTTLKLKYKDEINNITERFYNNKNIVSEIFIQQGDTINEIDYSYNENRLSGKTIIDYNKNILVSYSYDSNEMVTLEDVYEFKRDSLIQVKKVDYSTNHNGRIIKKVETDILTNDKRFIEFRIKGKEMSEMKI